jgi:hypothetical protein
MGCMQSSKQVTAEPIVKELTAKPVETKKAATRQHRYKTLKVGTGKKDFVSVYAK